MMAKSMLDKGKPALEDVKVCIRADHAAIRDRLTTLESLASSESGTAATRHAPALAGAIWSLFLVFDEHLGREERDLFPYVAELQEPARLDQMREEHAQQRTVLLAIVDDSNANAEGGKVLAEDVKWLVHSLREDMLREETALDALSDVGYVVDQCTG